MLELRILSGLHRGVALPLDGDAIRLGSGTASDVVLLDPDMPEHAAMLERKGDGSWLLTKPGSAEPPSTVAAHMQLSLGPILIGFAHEDEPWRPCLVPAVPAAPIRRRTHVVVAWIVSLAGVMAAIGLFVMLSVTDKHVDRQSRAAPPESLRPAPAVRTLEAIVHPARVAPARPPFGVVSVRSGPHGFVVTDDAHVLVPGNTWRHYTLVRIEPGRLVFSGPQPAELPW